MMIHMCLLFLSQYYSFSLNQWEIVYTPPFFLFTSEKAARKLIDVEEQMAVLTVCEDSAL